MKKILLGLILSFLVGGSITNVKAINTVQIKDETILKANEELNQKKLEELDLFLKKMKESRSVITDTRSGWLSNFPTYQQEKSWWCAPASVKESLQYINGSSLSQTTYATHMNTSVSSGTDPYYISVEMNQQQNTPKRNDYGFRAIKSSIPDDKNRLWQIVMEDTLKNVPVIAAAQPKFLYRYNGVARDHYITLIGYRGLDWAEADKKILYVDSNYEDFGRGKVLGQYWESFSNVYNAIKDHYIIW